MKHWFERGESTDSPLVKQIFDLRLRTSVEEGVYPR